MQVLTFDISVALHKIANFVLANISYGQYRALDIVDPVPIPRTNWYAQNAILGHGAEHHIPHLTQNWWDFVEKIIAVLNPVEEIT